jgi:hypothetical protein
MQLVNWFSQSGGLHGGELHCGTFNVSGAADVGIGSFWPYPRGNPLAAGSLNIGGTATVTVDSCTIFVTNSIDVRGDSSSSNATLNLQNAIFSVSNLTMHENSMANFGGSGQISNSLSMYGGKFLLWNGTLDSPYIGVGPDATFTQSYGANSVHGVLSISGNYEFTGGKLLTDGIFLRGSLLLGPLSSYARTNVNTFTNTGLVDLGGYLGFGLTNGWGGQVRLSTNAVLDFIGSPAQLRFAASSAVAWTPGALMVISNWNNSGNVRLFFGNNASALTSSQLSQIQFSNPSGFAPGNYPAQMLSTGEVVPKVPLLTSSRSGNMLTLAWGPGWTLQSSTNIAGPYQDVPGAASPYAGSMDKPRQFFRLRQ